MIIANPIYDVTFKRLLENDRAAKFFIGTILDCEVISLEPTVQERTMHNRETREISLFRMDFAATIETKEEGKKRVIIEMQKALHFGDIYRFKNYLGEEYKRSKYPIISIYILGFNLSVDSPAFAAIPDCRDLTTNKKLEVNDSFVEYLTHRAYFVQTLRIKPSFNTKLEKLLSIFEQANFVGDNKTTKDFALKEDKELEDVLKVLHYVAADKEARDELDKEEYYQEAMEGMFGEKDRKLAEKDKKLFEKDKELAEKNKEIENLKKQIEKMKK
ncbi:MAG: hypothetical protein FWF51_04240 [Chitinivibrionia bacterium]|nr:hypothetical protein [Chitinivibrionia bacterium]